MIDVEHLVKDYGTVVAVRDLTFHVGRGEIVGFLGPNGAGKSTTLRILAGFLGATSGQVRIDGHDIVEDGLRARRCIGYMPEAAPLYGEMRVREYLAFRAELKGVGRRTRAAAVGRAMEAAAVTEMRETLIGHLSKGYRQRVGLADALVANPPLLILDEPTAGLDPNQIREVRRLVRALGENHTLLLSTHILSEVESTCDRALVIDRGRLVAEGTLKELKAQRRGPGAMVVITDPEGRAEAVVQSVGGVASVASFDDGISDGTRRLRVVFVAEDDGEGLAQVVSALVGAGMAVREASPEKATLEDVFAELTRAEPDRAREGERS
jgi:ABC-2 type transport system ATP-binding protein